MESDNESCTIAHGPSSYAAQPLSPGQIRLLAIDWVIEPSLHHVFPWMSPRWSLDLRTYRVVLEDDGDYEAISYVWGSAPASLSAMCNGCPLLITPTLHEMLVQLGQDKGIFWIDAICIDQNNPDEKAMQIPLMHLIYSRAKVVVVWLGASHPSVTVFMKDLSRVYKLSRSWEHREKTTDIFWRGKEWPPDGDSFWDGLFHLVHNPWFTRLWTFQEVALAKRAYMLVEETWTPLHEFLTFFWPGSTKSDSYLHPENHHYERMPFLSSYALTTRNACCVIARRYGYRRGAPVQPVELPDMLYHIRHRGVKERIDRVWAMAGVFPEDLRTRLSPEVDYSEDACSHYWRAYIAFAKAVFEGEQSLALLNWPPSAGRHNIHLPSWCPDLSAEPEALSCDLQIDCWWRQSSASSPSVWWSDLHFDEQDVVEKRAAINNHHPSKLISIGTTNPTLHIQGFVVDAIEEVVDGTDMLPLWKRDPCRDLFDLDPGNVITRIFINFFLRGLALAQRTFPSQGDTAHGLPKEFVACLFLESRVSIRAERVCESVFRCLEFLIKRVEQSHAGLTTEERHWYTKLWRRLLVMNGHSFLATSSGRFGVATPGCKLGDKICVFYGGDPIYILPSEGTGPGAKAVKFGGVAFIPHMMDQDQRDNARLGPDEIFAIS